MLGAAARSSQSRAVFYQCFNLRDESRVPGGRAALFKREIELINQGASLYVNLHPCTDYRSITRNQTGQLGGTAHHIHYNELLVSVPHVQYLIS